MKSDSLPVLTDNAALVPPLHARWVDDLLGAVIPQESEATCNSCVMLPNDGSCICEILSPRRGE